MAHTAKTLLEDHQLHKKNFPLSNPKRKNPLWRLASPLIALALTTCLPNLQATPTTKTHGEQTPKPTLEQKKENAQSINLPPEWKPLLETLYKTSGTQPSKPDLINFHRKTQIQAEIEDAAQFLIQTKKLDPTSPEATSIKPQIEIEIEHIWRESQYNIPPTHQAEILKGLQILKTGKIPTFRGQPQQNQKIDTHKERLAVARDVFPDFDPFQGKYHIQESLKTKLQSTSTPKNIGTPTNKIIVVGEKHHDSKNQALYETLLENLHKKGFRTLSLELPQDLNKKPLEQLLQEIAKTPSSIQQDLLLETHISKHGLSKEWIKTYQQAKNLGWRIELTDTPSKEIQGELHKLETAKEELGKGHILTEKTLQKLKSQKDNLAGLPQQVWETIQKMEKEHIEARSQHIAKKLTTLPGKVLHIGGSAHTSEIQDGYAQLTGKRPLGLQIQYHPPSGD
jgi:hypothetical protein